MNVLYTYCFARRNVVLDGRERQREREREGEREKWLVTEGVWIGCKCRTPPSIIFMFQTKNHDYHLDPDLISMYHSTDGLH